MTVGKKIENYRKQLKLSQEELGNKLFVSRQTVSQWENDQTSPTVDNFLRLCDVFGISMNDFFEEKVSDLDKAPEFSEHYKWKYSEDDLNAAFRVMAKKDTVVSLTILICEFFISVVSLIIKAYVGFSIVWAFMIWRIITMLSNRISYKNSCNRAKKNMINNVYHIGVDESSVVISVYDESEKIISLDRIYPIGVEKSWQTDDLFVLQYKNRRYILKKNELPRDSRLYTLLRL